MLLNALNREEKENFLELAYLVAQCDNDFDKREKKMIDVYRDRLELEDYEIQHKQFDEILDFFQESSFISKTSMLLELLSLVLADIKYDGNEQKIVKQIRDRWDISDDQFVSIANWLKDKEIIFKAENF